MKRKSLLLGSVSLCLAAWAEPSFAQSAQCIAACRNRIGSEGEVRYIRCLHVAPICTGQSFAGVPASKNPAAPRPGQAIAAQRAVCGADVGKLCQGIKPGGGRVWACLVRRKSELSPACKEVMARYSL
jgi:hypothetical protein